MESVEKEDIIKENGLKRPPTQFLPYMLLTETQGKRSKARSSRFSLGDIKEKLSLTDSLQESDFGYKYLKVSSLNSGLKLRQTEKKRI
jgi:hypothetical protein